MGRFILIIFGAGLALTAVFLLFFGSVVLISPEAGRTLGLEGDTYLLVVRPSPFERPFINLHGQLNDVVFSSLLNIVTFRGTNVPWYADRAYLAAHAFFAYSTKYGVITDPKFFDNPKK